MRELDIRDMSLEQKIGFVMIAGNGWKTFEDEEERDYILDLIRRRALGAVWVSCNSELKDVFRETIRVIRETADYPILILTDMECGFGDYKIGQPISLGYIGSERVAYAYGKAIAVEARKCGYSLVCNPLLDRSTGNYPCGTVLRQLHPDKEISARLAAAICRGMHDGGVLNCAKHYPSARGLPLDSHMAEVYSEVTREEVVNDSLYAYKYLNEQGLLDAVMVQHMTYVNIDKEYPASLSAGMNRILREDVGFNGIAMTDALNMMGVVAHYGEILPKWRAIEAGYDLSLGFIRKTKTMYDAIMDAYKRGDLSEENLNNAVTRVLAAQHRSLSLWENEATKLTEEENRLARGISPLSVAAICDDGLSPAIPRDGHHLFILMTDVEKDLSALPVADTMTVSWYEPQLISQRIRSLFPASDIDQISEYPSPTDVERLCRKRLSYDDVVMVTYFESGCYIGREAFTPRITSLFEAWQMSHAISALVHFGNPYLLEELPHIPRIISGCKASECTLCAIEVLAGTREAGGKLPFKLHLA